TYLALTFGTLLSSQGTDASFVLTLSGFPPGFPFDLASPTLPDSFVSDSRSKRVSLSSSSLSRFPFRRFQPYQILFRSISGPDLNSDGRWSGLRLSADSTLSEAFSRFHRLPDSEVRESMALRKFNFR
ncbi:hypothetical protein ABT126_05715, partial [Streptomyces sp. NPDC002012]|uniref:hypothetical protein n=1 Tax=Streptomyces sp. NPDC002012 TaxID=3154532 RepID=UPI003333364B